MCKKNYLSPRVKTVAFEVEDGYQASLSILNSVRTQEYDIHYGDCADCCSQFWDPSFGTRGLSTTEYDDGGELTF